MKHVTEIELIDYVNGSVEEPQRVTIEDHLAECNFCRKLCEQTKLIYDSLDDLTVPQAGDFRARVLQRAARPKRSVAMLFARVAAVIIIAALTGYFAAVTFTPRQQSDPVSILKTQSEISFTQPARHIAMAVSGEAR